MGFLGNKGKGGGSTVVPFPSGPKLPSVAGTTPPVTATAGSGIKSAAPQVCNHCGKDPSSSPERASPELVRHMLDALDSADGVSVWEDKFCADMEIALQKYKSLTPKQYALLTKIYDERVK